MSVEEILHARMADAHKDQQQWNVDPTAHGIYAEPQQIPAEQKESKAAAGGRTGPSRHGQVLLVSPGKLGSSLKSWWSQHVSARFHSSISTRFWRCPIWIQPWPHQPAGQPGGSRRVRDSPSASSLMWRIVCWVLCWSTKTYRCLGGWHIELTQCVAMSKCKDNGGVDNAPQLVWWYTQRARSVMSLEHPSECFGSIRSSWGVRTCFRGSSLSPPAELKGLKPNLPWT